MNQQIVSVGSKLLTSTALSYAVAMALGYRVGPLEEDPSALVTLMPDGRIKFIKGGTIVDRLRAGVWDPHCEWSHTGPIKSANRINTRYCDDGTVEARIGEHMPTYGSNELEAILRCFVHYRLGPTVNLPAALFPETPAKSNVVPLKP